MTFTVEDGTGLTDSNAYISLAFADSYFSDRGIAAWTGADAVKQQAIIRATDYIDKVWGRRFLGTKKVDGQALEFPRDAFDTMPPPLLKGCAEYALRALSASLLPDPTTDPSGLKLSQKTTKVGPIESSATYAADQGVTLIKAYPAADLLLRQLCGAQGVIRN